MLTIHVWPKWVKEFLLTHPLYKSPTFLSDLVTAVRRRRSIVTHPRISRTPDVGSGTDEKLGAQTA